MPRIHVVETDILGRARAGASKVRVGGFTVRQAQTGAQQRGSPYSQHPQDVTR